MCFDPITSAVIVGGLTAVSSAVSQQLQISTQNEAAANQYNQQARQAEQINQAAIKQQQETDSRNRIQRLRSAETALDKARAAILENRKRQGTARATAGTSGLMGLPLEQITQNYDALVGGVNTNLSNNLTQLNENYFFDSMNSALRAQDITNRAIPVKPQMQSFGFMNAASALVSGALGGYSSYRPSPTPVNTTATNQAPFDPFVPPFVPDNGPPPVPLPPIDNGPPPVPGGV